MTISKQKVHVGFRLSISIVLLGALFKILHWPYGWLIMVLGAIGTVVFYSIKFYQKQQKQLLDYARLLLIVAFLFHYAFRVLHLDYGYIFTLLTQAALIIFLILYVKEVLFPSTENSQDASLNTASWKKNSVHLLSGLAVCCIVIGALFKILHWEFHFINGTRLLIVGLLMAIVPIIIGAKDA